MVNGLSNESERKYWIYAIVSSFIPLLLTIYYTIHGSSSEYFMMGLVMLWGFWSAIPLAVVIWSRENILRIRRTREESQVTDQTD